MSDMGAREYVLGIDLGSNSLGWAIVGLVDGEPDHLVRAGVRVFEAGMDGDVASGREESRNLKRRQVRLQRRQTWRRARRLRKIFNLLQRCELLPAGSISTPGERQDFVNRLDTEIRGSKRLLEKANSGRYPEAAQTMPYILRAAALDEPLEPFFLGRALYHLAQRRGFRSNRTQVAKKDDDEGAVKEGIAALRKAMQEASARTLGEYFSRIAPSQERIRCRWTARDMYENEFEAIWAAQSKYHPELLTEERKRELRDAIFSQRRLWFDPNTIGRCELEPGERRAAAYLLVSQRFRLLDKVNNLQINGLRLTPGDRAKLIQELELHGDLAFKKVRKLLGLTKHDEINLERGGEEKLPGNRTFARFNDALGPRWVDMSREERERLVEYIHAFEKPDKLPEAARKRWNLDEDAANKFGKISLEPECLNLSVKAIRNLLPLLEEGRTYGEARKLAYPESFRSSESKAFLPSVQEALAEIRNPAVMRSLTELRKVVNAIVHEHGKPTFIRIELAREIKKSKKQRAAISERNRGNEKARTEAAKKIVAEAGVRQPKPEDIRKAQLWQECGGICPYTGKAIPFKALFGPEPQFDIEHIIPFSVSMDNSFQNLTLCYVPENRIKKGNKTPHQAYAGDAERYEAVLERVKHFTGERAMVAAKRRRFEMNDEKLEEFLTDFRDRQLNDTAYASSLAARYLGVLYGGVIDAQGRRRVQATSGRATAFLRSLWELNAILNDGPTTNGGRVGKKRTDHRHHAIDALVIGLTDASMVKRLADAAQRAPLEHHRHFASLQAPWNHFAESVRAETDKIVVSHRVSKKVSGPLHEETIYSASKVDGKVRVRKPLVALTKNEVEDIADKGVKELVVAKLNGGDPKKVFASEENLPFFETSDGGRIPIKRVRVSKAVPIFTLGEGRTARHVASESNHHIEIFAELDKDGNEVEWDGSVVSMAEAFRRLRAKEPVVKHNQGLTRRFKFSLSPSETIGCKDKLGGWGYFVVRKMSQLTSGQIQIGMAPLSDARKAKEMQTSRAWLWVNPDTLRRRDPRKVVVGPLGEVSEAHD